MDCAIFLIYNFFLVSLERNYLYLTFKSRTSAVFYVFTVTMYTAKHVDDNMTYLW